MDTIEKESSISHGYREEALLRSLYLNIYEVHFGVWTRNYSRGTKGSPVKAINHLVLGFKWNSIFNQCGTAEFK